MLHMKKLVLLFSLALLTSCHPSPSLQGTWAVDLAATIDRAKASGLPDSVAGPIRELYDGGMLEITSDKLLLYVDGFDGTTEKSYEVVSESDGCYTLEISDESATHEYCIEGESLVVHDPSAKIALVFSER